MIPDNNKPDHEEIPPPPPPPPPPFYGGTQSPYGPPLSPLPQFGNVPPMQSQPGSRPGCVTAYVILLALGVVLTVCGGLSFMLIDSLPRDSFSETEECYDMGDRIFCGTVDEYLEELYGVALPVIGVVMLVFAVLYGFTAVGLWRMKKWGWILVLLSLGLSMVLGFLNLITGNFLSIVSLIVAGLIMMWFVQNRWRFV